LKVSQYGNAGSKAQSLGVWGAGGVKACFRNSKDQIGSVIPKETSKTANFQQISKFQCAQVDFRQTEIAVSSLLAGHWQ